MLVLPAKVRVCFDAFWGAAVSLFVQGAVDRITNAEILADMGFGSSEPDQVKSVVVSSGSAT